LSLSRNGNCCRDDRQKEELWEACLSEANDQNEIVLANLPAGRTERRTALVVSLTLLGIGALVVPFGTVRLSVSNAWVPILTSFMIVADLLTWFLLISQFNIVRSRALLVLASGYFFAAAINIPILLTFPGAFSPDGLLNSGLQSTLWLGLSRFAGYSLAVIVYAVMNKEPRAPELKGSSRTAVAASIAIVIAIVLAWTLIATTGESHLPKLLLARGQPSAGFQFVAILISLLTATDLLLLWFQRRTVLNLWLMVATCAWLAQQIAKFIHFSGAFTFSFYASTALLFISSTVLLVVLLKETMTLYGRLAVSLVALRRLSAEKLLRSEAYLSEAQRLSHTGSFGRSLLSGEIYWSDETYRIFEHDRSVNPTLESVLQRIHPDDVERVGQTIDRATKERTGFDIECRLMRMDGSVKYLHVIARAPEPSSDDFEFVGAVTDVTDRKHDEEKLRRSEESLLEAQRLSHTGSWRRDVASGAVIISPEIYRIFGISPSEAASKADFWVSRIHPEDRKRVVELVQRSQIDKADYESDYRIVLPDGSIKHLHATGHPVLNESGDIIEFVGTSIDVTAAKLAEETLRQSEAYLAEAQRLSHTGSWAWNSAAGETRYWSEECYRVLGFDPYGGLPRFEAFWQRLHPDDRPRIMEEFERANHDRAEYEMDYRIVLPSGEIRDIHTVGHPVLTSSGDLLEFVGTVIDVTERKQAEEERERLRQAQADLARVSRVTTMGELAASLAHEIKQPIAAAVIDAKTCLRWLTRDQPDMEEACEAASRTVTDATRAVEIISRIRSQFQKGSLDRELVDVNEVIREMIALLQSEAMQSNISVRTQLASDLPQIMGDRLQLQQVTMNLIANSIDAMKDVDGPRELTIESQRTEEEQIQVSVNDTGVGLPPQQADKIFDPFFTTKPHGTGMGLRISSSIVESHGGHLWATANSGRGATFYFTMPTAEVVRATATLA
jgi:PAS domain S-box-containing protein